MKESHEVTVCNSGKWGSSLHSQASCVVISLLFFSTFLSFYFFWEVFSGSCLYEFFRVGQEGEIVGL